MVNLNGDVCQEAEETVITNFLQFVLDDTEDYHREGMSTVHCNHIRISTFITESTEPLALCVDTRAPKQGIGRKQMKRILDK